MSPVLTKHSCPQQAAPELARRCTPTPTATDAQVARLNTSYPAPPESVHACIRGTRTVVHVRAGQSAAGKLASRGTRTRARKLCVWLATSIPRNLDGLRPGVIRCGAGRCGPSGHVFLVGSLTRVQAWVRLQLANSTNLAQPCHFDELLRQMSGPGASAVPSLGTAMQHVMQLSRQPKLLRKESSLTVDEMTVVGVVFERVSGGETLRARLATGDGSYARTSMFP